MPTPADPGIHTKLREQALQLRLPDLPPDAVHAILLDWRLGDGIATVLATADGTASVYLSSGGGYLGGSQASPLIRAAALHAIELAPPLLHHLHPTQFTPLPPSSIATFYITLSNKILTASSSQIFLVNGSHPLAPLAVAMQQIMNQYRAWEQNNKPTPGVA